MLKNRGGLLGKKFLLAAPMFHDWDFGSYLQGLFSCKGIECKTFAYQTMQTEEEANKQMLRVVADYRPDICLGLKMDRIWPSTLNKIKRKNIFLSLWYCDCFSEEVLDWVKPLFKEVDLFLTSAKGLMPKYKLIGDTPTYWVFEGAYLPAFPRIKLLQSWKKTYGSQIAFIGNIFQPPVPDRAIAMRRYQLLKKISKKYQLKVWGLQGDPFARKKWGLSGYPVIEWPAYNEEVVKICQASDIILGINTINTVELYFSNRTFLTLAAGGFHITSYVPWLESMFTNHKHLVWYNSDEECMDIVAYYLKRPRMRKKVSQEGQRLVRKKYSMKRQLNKALGLIEKHYG